MNTKHKNVVKQLLEIYAERYDTTFGKYLSWEIKRTSTNPGGRAKWTIDIYEENFTGASHYFREVAKICEAALVSSYMTIKEGEIKFNLY